MLVDILKYSKEELLVYLRKSLVRKLEKKDDFRETVKTNTS